MGATEHKHIEASSRQAWGRQEFESQLRAKSRGYYSHHPFHVRLTSGGCTPDEIRCWIINHFYYQSCLPRKDAAILAHVSDRSQRQIWLQRILDQDGLPGSPEQPGMLEAWTLLAEAAGIDRNYLWSQEGVAPAVRFACDAYIQFASRAVWQEAVCATLSEMFVGQMQKERIVTWPHHYPWIEQQALTCFRADMQLSSERAEHALSVTLNHFKSRDEQDHALRILQFKLDVLWSMLDAIEQACV